MQEWVYKANGTKIGCFETRHLAMKWHFLCRSAVERDWSQADRVRVVNIGDVIHFYYTLANDRVREYGSFVVISGSEYPTQFGEQVEGTALFKVRETPENAEMIGRLTEEHDKDPTRGYERDPEQSYFTGWVIRRLDSSENAATQIQPAEAVPWTQYDPLVLS